MKKIRYVYFAFVIMLLGCEKFLDEKSNQRLVVPNTLRDLQSLLDNQGSVNTEPGEGEVSSDDYFLSDDSWNSMRNEEDRRAYTWEPDYSTTQHRWTIAYRNVYWANIVLENLEEIPRSQLNHHNWDNIKGQALFLRAKNFLNVALIWALSYESETAENDLGIPLRLHSDFNISSKRSSLAETYSQIVYDLKTAIELLPNNPLVLTRASKPAAKALLARTYLFMRDYENCLKYANGSLEISASLIDFNKIDTSLAFPIPRFEDNVEVLYHSTMSARPQLNMNIARIDTNVVESYDDKDLRKVIFFRKNSDGTSSFKGSYTNSANLFFGISTSEVLLMRAECLARRGETIKAMNDLNYLLIHRYKNEDPFMPLAAHTTGEALRFILEERRKELLLRGLRFPDVKRLNKEGAAIGFKRVLGGVDYSLPANDLRFALPIPEAVIERAPEIIQNRR